MSRNRELERYLRRKDSEERSNSLRREEALLREEERAAIEDALGDPSLSPEEREELEDRHGGY